MADKAANSKAASAIEYSQQAERLSGHTHDAQDELSTGSTTAFQAKFITPQDPVIETTDGNRLPSVPMEEAQKLNRLKNEIDHQDCASHSARRTRAQEEPRQHPHNDEGGDDTQSTEPSATLRSAIPPSKTNPLFPPLPLYGPSTWVRELQCLSFRLSSSILSLAFLAIIVLGAAATSLPLMFRHIAIRLRGGDPDARRPFYQEELRRKAARRDAAKAWNRDRRRQRSHGDLGVDNEDDAGQDRVFVRTEGGKDPLICDAAYYARRVGLDIEEFQVQTEDGFILDLWHVYDPREYNARPESERNHRGPDLFRNEGQANGSANGSANGNVGHESTTKQKARYPVLLVHGLLQSAGAYCTNDDDSLAFFLCKSGYDVWLGNNRCGFKPKHTLLPYSDPRMWAWNIRQMGVMDLPALVARVLSETGFEKLGLVCHSQGTTETFVALAKGQRPDLGAKISVFCALAPAVYAGPLIGKAYFKFMRVISPALFRIIFGIHAFIPFMMLMHSMLPGTLYGALGYRVFSFLFNWTDDRWDQDIRDRLFQFSPVYVSAESMRWWLGRECFAKQKCILSTKEEIRQEQLEDEQMARQLLDKDDDEDDDDDPGDSSLQQTSTESPEMIKSRGARAWYDEQAPPFALWVAGNDDLVDGRRLIRRFKAGREPFVRVVHAKVIEEYEHLDVIWALDSIEKVGNEVKEVLWKTIPKNLVDTCRLPRGCEEICHLD